MPPRRFHRVAAYRGSQTLRATLQIIVSRISRNIAALYSRRLAMSHESQPSASFVSGVGKLCPRPRAIADDESRITAEHIICFRGTQTVPVAESNKRHHHKES